MNNDPNNPGRGGYISPHTQVPRNGYQPGGYGAPSSNGGGGDDGSPFYKPQAPSVSLPKGGGALKGIDEQFTVNPVNGTASLEIPLPLTPGRNGFNLELFLQYNSGSGNSVFGQG